MSTKATSDNPVQIGFQDFPGEGPGIFLSRLKKELEKSGQFSRENPDVWIQLSYKDLPNDIQDRKNTGDTKVIVRMNGAYCNRYNKIRKPFTLPLPILDDWYSDKKNGQRNDAIRQNLMNADRIVYQSWFSCQITQKFVCKTPTAPIIYNGVDLDQFNPDGELSDRFDEKRLNLLVSHSFKPYHRLHDQMKILAAAKESQPTIKLNILGGGDEASFDYAKQIAGKLGLKENNDYEFLGKLSPEELPAIYRSCDMMLNLSYWDSCPNVAIEAMASGLPIVGVWSGGLAELSGDVGVLIPEKIPFTYHYHHDFHKMPQAPIDAYVDGINTVAKDKLFYALKSREKAEEKFDIKQIASQYALIAESLK